MIVPILSFSPDVDTTQKGVVVAAENALPTMKGFKPEGAPVASTAPSLGETVIGSAVLQRLDATHRIFAGTPTKIYELTSATAWTDRSAVGGYSTSTRFRFAQFSDVSLASNGVEKIQESTSGAFTEIAAAPAARIIITAGLFVLAFNTADATYGTAQDRWRCSGIGDHTAWTPSSATQAATGQLRSAPGPITAAAKIGNTVVAFKERAMFLGVYQGPPLVWDFTELSNTVGCVSQEALATFANKGAVGLFFVGPDDFYIYDGGRPVAIGDGVKEWFFQNLSNQYRDQIFVTNDERAGVVRIHYPDSNSSGKPNATLIYNYRAGRWGVGRSGEVTFPLINQTLAITIDDLATLSATIDGLPSVSFDSAYWSTASRSPAYFNSTGQLYLLTGTTAEASITTGDIGIDGSISEISRIRPRLAGESTASASVSGRDALSDQPEDLASGDMTSNRIDLLSCARWQRIQFSWTGGELTALDVEMRADTPE